MFNKLYKHYKDNFDLELSLTLSKKTYKQAEREQQRKDNWEW